MSREFFCEKISMYIRLIFKLFSTHKKTNVSNELDATTVYKIRDACQKTRILNSVRFTPVANTGFFKFLVSLCILVKIPRSVNLCLVAKISQIKI